MNENTPPLPLAELTRRAIELLTREFGLAEAQRFLNQFSTGSGDYVAERRQIFAGKTLPQIVGEIKAARPNPPQSQPPDATGG